MAPVSTLESFCEFAAGRPLVGHNGFGYDYRLLDATAERTGVRLPAVTRLDSLELAHLVYPRAAKSASADIDGHRPPKGHSLDALAGFLLGARPRATGTLTVTCSGDGVMSSFQRLPTWTPDA
ncbi:MAG: hypothetical protein OXG52_05290 [bacterium]|nr:hypothetical protein [bacterium]